MNVLLLGSGGREHAIGWKLSQSPLLTKLYIAPGNAGTSKVGENVALGVNEFDRIAEFVSEKGVDMLVVGPEDPLVNGIVDYFATKEGFESLKVIGPDKHGATLEGSKAFAKEFMREFGVPTAAYRSFGKADLAEAIHYLDTIPGPYVLKADGLAAGKGVLIIEDAATAKAELELMMSGKFGAAGDTVVIEQFLKGIEFSVFAITDGKDYQILPVAKDYKRIGEGDTGLNTGGMGAVSPPPFVTDEVMKNVEREIVIPTIHGIASRGMSYKGFVFFGLIWDGDKTNVIEYNCRMGDPETEVVMPRLESDLLQLFADVCEGNLSKSEINHAKDVAVTVMLVSGGYPEDYEKGKAIAGLDAVDSDLVFHAGTAMKDGTLVTNGGRVIALTSLASSINEALANSMGMAEAISYEGKYYRRDIGKDLLIYAPK